MICGTIPPSPPGVTRYMWRKYLSDFIRGTQFWTSEDGDAGELVILPSPDSIERLQREFFHLHITATTVRHGFVRREYVGSEFFDAPYGRRQGMVWRLSDKPTSFPVHIVDPYTKINSRRCPVNGPAPVGSGNQVEPA